MKIFVNMDAQRLAELSEKTTVLSEKDKADLSRIADNLQRMDEKLMNQDRFDC